MWRLWPLIQDWNLLKDTKFELKEVLTEMSKLNTIIGNFQNKVPESKKLIDDLANRIKIGKMTGTLTSTNMKINNLFHFHPIVELKQQVSFRLPEDTQPWFIPRSFHVGYWLSSLVTGRNVSCLSTSWSLDIHLMVRTKN